VRTLGSRYVLHELLGQGTTGEVWRATRRTDGAAVAVKVLRPEFADDPVVVDRFLREWRILYDLNSPDLVRVLDLVNEPDALGIVMELVDGVDLRDHLRDDGPLPVGEAVRIVVDVLWALDTVHGAGIVHRDVKPENVLIDGGGGSGQVIRLTDFGIARMVDNPSRQPDTGPIGTPLYMAPELGLGSTPTPAADIYSAGVVLYELLAGMPPFDEAHPTDMLRAHREQNPMPIKGVPGPVWDVLADMLAKSPQHRPPTAADAAEALVAAMRREHERDRGRGYARQGAGGYGVPAEAYAGTSGMSGRSDGPDWSDERTQIGGIDPVPADPRRTGPAPTRVAAAAGLADDWDSAPTGTHAVIPGRGDAATGQRPAVRIPARPGETASDRNTLISAISTTRQPGAGPGGRPPVRDKRQRLRVAAGAGLVVALVAGAGGWALAAASGPAAVDASGQSGLSADPNSTWTPTMDAAGNLITSPPAGEVVIVSGSPSTRPAARQSASPGASGSPNAGAPGPTRSAPPSASPTPTDAVIPNVRGKGKNEAVAALSDAGFTNVATADKCFDDGAPGTVQSQSPTSGTKTDKTTSVSLTIVGDCVAVPKVTGMSPDAAKAAVQNVGLTAALWTTCDYGYSPVTGQDPAPGGLLTKGSWVTLSYTCKASPSPAPAPTN
jgi:serine/threonine-protein kinase